MIWEPRVYALDLEIATKKQTSASMNPTSQWGDGISLKLTKGLATVITSGKELINTSDKPLFIEALMPTIFFNPSVVRCSFFFIKHTICLNNSKSACFCVNNGYLSKWGIITLIKSLIDFTVKIA